jgi:hypothetical protein
MYLQGHNTATSDIERQYDSPLNTLNAMKSQPQVQQPGIGQLAPTAQQTIAPPNYHGAVQSNYNDLTSQYNAQAAANATEMGGPFGLGGKIFGGLLSDEKDKTDKKYLKTGEKMHAFRYKDDPKSYPKVVGVMAGEHEKKRPGSTRKIGGHRVINNDNSSLDDVKAAVASQRAGRGRFANPTIQDFIDKQVGGALPKGGGIRGPGANPLAMAVAGVRPPVQPFRHLRWRGAGPPAAILVALPSRLGCRVRVAISSKGC